MAEDEIRIRIGYQPENQTNIGWTGYRLTDSGISSKSAALRVNGEPPMAEAGIGSAGDPLSMFWSACAAKLARKAASAASEASRAALAASSWACLAAKSLEDAALIAIYISLSI
jgi:hypothetical protein